MLFLLYVTLIRWCLKHEVHHLCLVRMNHLWNSFFRVVNDYLVNKKWRILFYVFESEKRYPLWCLFYLNRPSTKAMRVTRLMWQMFAFCLTTDTWSAQVETTAVMSTWPSGKLTFECQKIAKNLTCQFFF